MPYESSSFNTLLEAHPGRDSALAHISEALTTAEATVRRTASEAHEARTRASRLHDSYRCALQRTEALEAQARRERAWAIDLGRVAQTGEADAKIAEEAMRRAEELLIQLRKIAVEEVTRHFALTRVETEAASVNGTHVGSRFHNRTVSQATTTTSASSTSTIGQWTTPTTSPTSTTGTLVSTNGPSPESPWSDHIRDRTITPSMYYPAVPDLNSILEAEQERIAALSSNVTSTRPSTSSSTTSSTAYATATTSPRAPRLEPQPSPQPFLQHADTQLPPASALPNRLDFVGQPIFPTDAEAELLSHGEGPQHRYMLPRQQQNEPNVVERQGVALSTPIPIPGTTGTPSRTASTGRRRSSVSLPATTPSVPAFDRARPGTAQNASARQPSLRFAALGSPIVSSAAAYLPASAGRDNGIEQRATGLGLELLYKPFEEMERVEVLQRLPSVTATTRWETPSHQSPGAPRLGLIDLPLASSPFLPSTPPLSVQPTGLVAGEPTTPSSATRGSVSGAWWRQASPASVSSSQRRPRASSNVSSRTYDSTSGDSIGVSVMAGLMRSEDEHVERGLRRRERAGSRARDGAVASAAAAAAAAAATRFENDPLMPYPVSAEGLVPVPLLSSSQGALGQAREIIENARRATSRSPVGATS
ncbi:hypothetical protein OC861_005973 [Tilletia horrida]|nr:hypothetical protein OC861_005973 [Tilletia horrida]